MGQGQAAQRLFGLMICFLTFGAYTMVKPYADDNSQAFAVLAQVRGKGSWGIA